MDHINRNKLDNRKANLRIATPSMNSYNATRKPGSTGEKYITKYDGIYRVVIGGKYIGGSTDFGKAITIRNEAFEKSDAKKCGATL